MAMRGHAVDGKDENGNNEDEAEDNALHLEELSEPRAQIGKMRMNVHSGHGRSKAGL